MSTIRRMYKDVARAERETAVTGSTIKKVYTPHLTDFACHVQPMGSELSQNLMGTFGKNWLLVCPVLDIREGDKIIVNNSTVYKVMGVETFNFSRNPHLEVTINTFKS